jgi:transcription initiation factor TFIIIB Brf1 subunit/transcription initiation factor TFIIB
VTPYRGPVGFVPPRSIGIEKKWAARDRIVSYLELFHLDNEHVVESVVESYEKIYGARGEKNRFRKSDYKERIAIAFSICNVLAKENMPRPPHYVARVCEVPCRPLLNMIKEMHLTPEELVRLKREDYELQDSPPQDYIDVVCSQINIPFATASQMRRAAEELQWTLHGRYPTVIAATAMQLVLRKRGELERGFASVDICEALGCGQKAIDQAIAALRAAQ